MKKPSKTYANRMMRRCLSLLILVPTLLLSGSTIGYSAAVKTAPDKITLERKDLNEIKNVLQEVQHLRDTIAREREAYDKLSASRTAYDRARDAETDVLREALKAAQRQNRSDKSPHLIAFAEAYRDNEYDQDYRVGLRLEWRLF